MLERKIKPWLLSKTKEVFSEEMPEFIAMVEKWVKEKINPEEIIEKLEMILEEDSEKFVVSMWRSIIFEIEKVKKLLELNLIKLKSDKI